MVSEQKNRQFNKKKINNQNSNLNNPKKDSTEITELKKKIKILEAEKSDLEKKFNSEFLKLIEKKSQEASEILKKKEEELKVKYETEFKNTKDYIYEKQFATLVEILSQFNKVLNIPVVSNEIKNYLIGFKMFSTQFDDLLESLNIYSIEPKKGDNFDSESMIVVSTDNVNDSNLENKVLEVFSKGYKLHRRVIKLAPVKVGVLKS